MLGLFQSWWSGVKSSFSAETDETQAEMSDDRLSSQTTQANPAGNPVTQAEPIMIADNWKGGFRQYFPLPEMALPRLR